MPLCLVNSPSAITMKGVFVTVIVQVYFFSMSNVILLFFNLKMSHCYKNTLVSKLHWHSSLVWKRLLILCLSFLDNVHNKNSFGEANDHELSSTWLAKDKKGFFLFRAHIAMNSWGVTSLGTAVHMVSLEKVFGFLSPSSSLSPLPLSLSLPLSQPLSLSESLTSLFSPLSQTPRLHPSSLSHVLS